MEHYQEEILESVWMAEEDKKSALKDVQAFCAKEELSEDKLKALAEEGFIRIEGEDVYFTPKGREQARQLIRRHRLSECLMGYVLNLDPETMERVACETEHSLLPEVEESICTLLGHPEVAPDGRAVPSGKCCAKGSSKIKKTIVSIAACEPGESLKIAYVKSKSHSRLQQLSSFGIVPGLQVHLLQKSPAYCLKYENTEIAIDREIAEDIFVWRV